MNAMLNAVKVGISVECVVCHLEKAPRGRSVPIPMASGLCSYDCSGYNQEPFPGSLWPNESEMDFGYPVGDAGTSEEGARE